MSAPRNGLTPITSMPADTMHCRRCHESVEVVRPWRGWRNTLYVWYGVMGLLVLLFPVMAADFCVMIPTMMVLIMAGSPLHRLAKELPVCAQCSLELPWDDGKREKQKIVD